MAKILKTDAIMTTLEFKARDFHAACALWHAEQEKLDFAPRPTRRAVNAFFRKVLKNPKLFGAPPRVVKHIEAFGSNLATQLVEAR
jgi:hypothetical protein